MCPDSTELGEFVLGLLSKKHARSIEQHASECLHCSREIAQLQEFLKAEDAAQATGLAEQMKVLVAELVSGVQKGAAGQIPALDLRGEAQDAFVYEADGVQVVIDIQESAESRTHKNLLGLVSGLTAQAYHIHLIFKGKTVTSSQVDEAGNFVIPVGEYQLIIRGPDVEIQILSLNI